MAKVLSPTEMHHFSHNYAPISKKRTWEEDEELTQFASILLQFAQQPVQSKEKDTMWQPRLDNDKDTSLASDSEDLDQPLTLKEPATLLSLRVTHEESVNKPSSQVVLPPLPSMLPPISHTSPKSLPPLANIVLPKINPSAGGLKNNATLSNSVQSGRVKGRSVSDSLVRSPPSSPKSSASSYPNSPDSSDEFGPKKKRRRTTPDQLDILEQYFQRDAMPSQQTRLEIAERLGMTMRRVQIWFQNKRAKLKRSNPLSNKTISASRSFAGQFVSN
jgi:hypothetical protein